MIFICLLLLGCGATSLITNYTGENSRENIAVSSVNAENKSAIAAGVPQQLTMKVYVSGAVAAPGIYELPEGTRADAAIEAAGGFTAAADLERVNLVKRLKDGSHVNVPTMSAKKLKERQLAERMNSTNSTNNFTVTGDSRANSNSAAIVADEQTAGQVVNINTATAEELETLPGIGPATAAKIIEHRSSNPFNSIEDLMQVRGIGKAKFAKLKGSITI